MTATAGRARRRIAILSLAEQDIRLYVLGLLAERWRSEGLEVDVLCDPSEHRDADLAILHVDLTCTPPAHVAWMERFPRVLNRRLTDIGKRCFTTLRVTREDGWQGPVLVKTNANYGGRPELELRRERLRRAAVGTWRGRLGLARRASRRLRVKLDPTAYPVYATASAVPEAMWDDPDLLVERFVPERDAEGYVLRKGCCLGGRTLYWSAHGNRPVLKGTSIHRRSVLEADAGIEAWRRSIGLDFGKVDYLRPAGQSIPIDVNPTPGCAGGALLPGIPPIVAALAPGIHDLLP